ncbi:replication initiation protein [Clostridioides difficile]|uniref:Replication initiation protein n=5 Tax=Clostridioides difficile TaxID=1496 RepID=A0A9P3YTH2_CLODI|nr:replication initiation protein [Clostridioides difficile]AWH79496.1 RepB family plasmid replication initiator protein [Clostridioides difficile]AWH83553.1 RepB family plasmid replication initiator protein [Clostridioides difficile]EGT2216357.1 RepB family plasmid replication initiator protein [Clostridioides difficile]EGT3890508.1 RepB family plasmid replication initiator protein [Clostridioides difficile]EGT3921730.1 RepB family plasmid replication initiator protein [Clostridioides diffici
MEKKEILMQPNNLIKSKYDFTNVENKLFYKILFNAQKQQNSSYVTTISKEELKVFMKNNNDYEHKNIKEILNMFQQSVLEFDYIEETTGKLKTFGSGLINTYELDHTDQIYTIMMHEVLYNHITDFVKMQKKKNGYTAINLSVLFNFRGAYTQRLYTLFRLWSRENKEVEIKYKLDELRFYLKLKDNVYPEYKYFKQNVLKRAMNEINKKGNMVVSIKEEKRKNRKIDEIIFSVIDYEPRKYFDKDILVEDYIPKKKQDNEVSFSFYIPNENIFTTGTIKLFKEDFKEFDFKKDVYLNAFNKSIAIAFERDNTDIINTKNYDFFKSTLSNKISEVIIHQKDDLKFKEELDKYWDDEDVKKEEREVDYSKDPVRLETVRRNLFDQGIVNEEGYYYK